MSVEIDVSQTNIKKEGSDLIIKGEKAVKSGNTISFDVLKNPKSESGIGLDAIDEVKSGKTITTLVIESGKE